VLLRFHDSVISTDAGPLAYGELDDAVSLTGMAGEALADAHRQERSSRIGLPRQSVFG